MRFFISLLFLFVFINHAQAVDIKEIFQNTAAVEEIKDEKTAEITKRLEEMDRALMRIEGMAVQKRKSGVLVPSQKTIDKGNSSDVVPADKTSQWQPISNGVKNPAEKNIPEWLFLLTGLALFLGLGILIIRYLKHKWKVESDKESAKIKSRLQEKEERLSQEEVIRKAIEHAQVQKEKDYEQLKNSFEFLKLELQRKNDVLMQKEAVIEEKERNSLQKEQECREFKKIVEALKDALVRRKMIGKSLSFEEDDKPWIPGESAERRELWRLDLSRDYNRTVLLRIDSEDKSKITKCFADNIGLGGLRFESETEFREKEILNLRLFFFGDKVPMMRIKAEVVWVKKAPKANYYGVSLLSQEDKNKAELKEYLESHMAK